MLWHRGVVAWLSRLGPNGKRRGGAPEVEIAHGDTILATGGEELWSWCSPAGRERLARRVALFRRAVGDRQRPPRVLELGCGTGLYTEQMAPWCGELVSVDISDALLERARERVRQPTVRFVRQNLEAIDPDRIGSGFQAVFGCSVLHHLDLEQTLPQLKRLVVPGAELVFSEPNLINPQVRLMFSRFAWARRKFAVSDTEMAFYPWELRGLFLRHGFEVLELFPFDFMHPAIPAGLVPLARHADRLLERVPGGRWLAGSCFVRARLPLMPS
ncbi:MAG TPA: class I SAM-dependent methyltransferase [Candidatus Binatia bacterium]|nr:class I SAM-dependent methyltransferase [Candidatus Binatia bacterium]